MAGDQIPPMHDDSRRQVVIAWGVAVFFFGLSYLSHLLSPADPFWACLCVSIGIVIVLRGHQPKWFIRHIEPQLIAGAPGRNVMSWKAWSVAIISALVLAGSASRVLKWRNLTQQTAPSARVEPCKINAVIDSLVVARLHSRGPSPKPSQTLYFGPTFQELFYDWLLTLSSNQYGRDVTVTLKDRQKPTYRLKTDPTETTVSDVIPGWETGFAEPRAPDFYRRTIKWEHLDKVATITIRRPIKFKRGTTWFDASSFPASEYEINSGVPCGVNESNIYKDANKRFLHLMPQVQSFSALKYRDGRPLKTLEDPDVPLPKLKPGEFETTVEIQLSEPRK